MRSARTCEDRLAVEAYGTFVKERAKGKLYEYGDDLWYVSDTVMYPADLFLYKALTKDSK